MIFTLFSMLPHRYLGKSFKMSGYKGTFYAGNFSKQTLTEFKQDFERIISTGNTIYNELIDNLYFLCLIISKIKTPFIVFCICISYWFNFYH